METKKIYCLECQEVIRGRTDKKFCSDSCRSLHHNRKKSQESDELKFINKRLKQNRTILQNLYNQSKNKLIPLNYVEKLGFTFNFFTHIDMDSDTQIVFCYEYGYRKVDEQKVQLMKQKLFSEGVDLIA